MARRLEQVRTLIEKNLGAIIRRELELPRGVIVGISKVVLDPDLKFAKILVSVLPEEKGEAMVEFLNNRKSLLRRALARDFPARITPAISFVSDPTEAKASRIDQLIDSLNLPDVV